MVGRQFYHRCSTTCVYSGVNTKPGGGQISKESWTGVGRNDAVNHTKRRIYRPRQAVRLRRQEERVFLQIPGRGEQEELSPSGKRNYCRGGRY